MSIRILVVDDNRDSLRRYVRALESRLRLKEWGQQLPEGLKEELLDVEEADRVPLALGKLRDQIFEILVVDLKMQGTSGDEMGGKEVITESLELDPLRPIIVITGHGTVELARQTLTQGVFDFIEKKKSGVNDLVNAVQKAIDSRYEKIIQTGNPFTPMTGTEPTVFLGRTQELEFFEQKLNRALHTKFNEHFLVLGQWGIGKSTLLKEYKKICTRRGHLASIAPLEPFRASATLMDISRSIVASILRGLPYPVDRFKKVANYFDSIGFTLLGTGLQFGRDTTKKELSPQAFLHDTFLNLWQDLKGKTGVLVILLDDLENVLSVPEIVMTLKSTLSMESFMDAKILLGMASTSDAWLQLTSIKKHHPLARYFLSRVELDALKENDVKDIIHKSLVRTGVSFNKDVLGKIFQYTEGHPFEMQVLCYHLFYNQILGRVDIDVWEKALQTAINDLGVAVFDFWYKQASKEERKVLKLIAADGIPVLSKEIEAAATQSNVSITPQNIRKYLQRLVEKKLVCKIDRGYYTIPDRMFQEYIKNALD